MQNWFLKNKTIEEEIHVIRLLNIVKYLLAQWAIGFAIAVFQGFDVVHWIDATFIVGLAMFVLSGIYYLKCQNAYRGFVHAMKKFIFAVIELFTRSDHTDQRRKLNEQKKAESDLLKGSEMFVASAITVASVYLFLWLFL